MNGFIPEEVGARYSNWMILGFDRIDKHNDARWFCKCELCGDVYSVKGYTLRNGQSTKCRPCAKRMMFNGRTF